GRLRRRRRLPVAVLDRAVAARPLLPALLVARDGGQGSCPRRRAAGDRTRRVGVPFHRRRFDVQPSGGCGVMLASDGRQDFSQRAVARAAALAGSDTVAVVTIAKIYGSSFGLPHPGLLPTKDELAERRGWVNRAIRELKESGAAADGQVAATRRAGKKLAAV